MTTSSANVREVYDGGPAWVRCRTCDELVCTIHGGEHAATCPCPPVEQWPVDPYATGRTVSPSARDALLNELVGAVKAARQAEEVQFISLQEARVYLGERQRAWQTAHEASRRALAELKAFIDRAAGLAEARPGGDW